ncbi:MAG TPA: DUF6526 family protein [Thermoanaerobaculia bacterium]|jgi:hypothetical protein|nr:DUF6526 family protein [Thermoanaerobaculia bacterium]
MSTPGTQSFANHARWVPLYHFALGAILLLNLVWSLVNLVRAFSFATVMGVLMAIAFVGLFAYLRTFPLTVQDRVIRLEMRLRLEKVLPADLKPRIADLSRGQLVALRFAGDAELPALVREVLDKKLTDLKAIKSRIRDWQADHFRA